MLNNENFESGLDNENTMESFQDSNTNLEQIMFQNKKNCYCGLMTDVNYFERLWRIRKRRDYVEFNANVKVKSTSIHIEPLKIKIRPISLMINDIVKLEKRGDLENEDYLHEYITWIHMKDGTMYKIYFKDIKHNKYDLESCQSFFEAVNWTFKKVQQIRETKHIEQRLKKKLLKIENFKKKIKEFLIPYEEISFERIGKNFDLDEQIIETEIKKLIKNNKIHGRLNASGIIINKLNANIQGSVQQSIQQSFNINLPKESKFNALICPHCNAPLPKTPPCQCEYCNVIIEDPNSRFKHLLQDTGITNQNVINSESETLGEVYEEVKEISSKIDSLDAKFEQMIINMDANLLLDYLTDESKNPEKVLQKVLENMKKHDFTKKQIREFMQRLKLAIDKRILLGDAFEKSSKEKIIKFLKSFAIKIGDQLLSALIITPIVSTIYNQ